MYNEMYDLTPHQKVDKYVDKMLSKCWQNVDRENVVDSSDLVALAVSLDGNGIKFGLGDNGNLGVEVDVSGHNNFWGLDTDLRVLSGLPSVISLIWLPSILVHVPPPLHNHQKSASGKCAPVNTAQFVVTMELHIQPPVSLRTNNATMKV